MIMHVVWSIAGNLPTPSSLRHALKSVVGHQSGYTNTAGSFAVISQGPHMRGAPITPTARLLSCWRRLGARRARV